MSAFSLSLFLLFFPSTLAEFYALRFHRIKRLRDESEKSYTTCLLDGRKEKVGNFRVEPPGLFRGRGEHPKKGTLKVSRAFRLRLLCLEMRVASRDLELTSTPIFLPRSFDCLPRTSPSTSEKTRLFLFPTSPESGRMQVSFFLPLTFAEEGARC